MVPDDAPLIAALEADIFPDPWGEKDIFSYICTSGSMCYTAHSDGKIIAYILGRTISPEGEIYRVATRPSHRRRGIAYRLLDYAIKTERGRGLECIFLEVRSKNIPARNLYHSLGFREMGERRNYYGDDDAVIMVKGNTSFI